MRVMLLSSTAFMKAVTAASGDAGACATSRTGPASAAPSTSNAIRWYAKPDLRR
jgi:hypothetical protein